MKKKRVSQGLVCGGSRAFDQHILLREPARLVLRQVGSFGGCRKCDQTSTYCVRQVNEYDGNAQECVTQNTYRLSAQRKNRSFYASTIFAEAVWR